MVVWWGVITILLMAICIAYGWYMGYHAAKNDLEVLNEVLSDEGRKQMIERAATPDPRGPAKLTDKFGGGW